MRQGEVYDLDFVGSRYRAVVLSADHHIVTGHPPLCAPVVRKSVAAADMSPYVVALTDADSVGGAVLVGKVGPVRIPDIAVPVGMVSGASMALLTQAVCELVRD